jgi:hypothetical protein
MRSRQRTLQCYSLVLLSLMTAGCATDAYGAFCGAKAVPLHATNALRERGVYLLLILGFGTRWRWVVTVTLRPHFNPRERTLFTHCTGAWVGPRVGLDTEARGKVLLPLPGIAPRLPGCPACSQSLYRLFLWCVCTTLI